MDNSNDAAAANQRRMQADPLETMLINMGYNSRIAGMFDSESASQERGEGESGSNIACRPS